MLENLESRQLNLAREGNVAGSSQSIGQAQARFDIVTGAPRTSSVENNSNASEPRDTILEEFINVQQNTTRRNNDQHDDLMAAIGELPRQVLASTTVNKKLQTQMPVFKGSHDKFKEFEHLIRNHLQPYQNRMSEQQKLQYFQSLLRDDAIEYCRH